MGTRGGGDTGDNPVVVTVTVQMSIVANTVTVVAVTWYWRPLWRP